MTLKGFLQRKNKSKGSAMMPIVLSLWLMSTSLIFCYTDPTACTSTAQYYSPLTLECTTCPSNTQQSSLDKTFCNCTNSFYDNWDSIGFNHSTSCTALGSTYDKTTQILSLYTREGQLTPNVITCDSSKAYANTSNQQCVSCGYDSRLVYDTTLQACQCSGGYIRIGSTCYQNNLSGWSRNFTTADAFNYLAEETVKIGCEQEGLSQPCNMLINMCIRNNYLATNFFCQLLTNLTTANSIGSLPAYTFSEQLTDSIGIYASSVEFLNLTTVKNQLSIMAVSYDIYGEIQDIAPIDEELFECSLNDEDVASFSSFGLNLLKYCSNVRTFSEELYYEFYTITSDGSYAEVPILIDGTYYKRLSPTASTNPHTLSIEMNSQPPLQVPVISYITASNPSIQTSSNTSEVSIVYLVPFIVFNIAILVCFALVFYRHVTFNPSLDDNVDPYFLCKGAFTIIVQMCYCWGYGLWIWSFGLATYVFTFYKFQKTIFLILPEETQAYEGFFTSIFIIQVIFGFLSVWNLLYNLSEVEYFLIDWEKQKDVRKFEVGPERREVSVWRKVLIVNELYEHAVRQTIDVYFVTLFGLLFLRGLEWMNLEYTIPNTSNLTTLSSTSFEANVVLSYFIITFVFFTVGAVQYIVRHLLKTWVPLEIENFVDLCAVCNISIMIFSETVHGYYIHGMNPLGQSEGSLDYIEGMFDKESKAFGKNRSFRNDDPDLCQTFEVTFPISVRRAFQLKYKSAFSQKLVSKTFNPSSFSNPLPDNLDESDYDELEKISTTMVESFKMYLESIKTSLMNLKERSWWEKFISCPIPSDQIGRVPLFFKDKWNDFSNVFLCGHEFLLLFNFINLINVWYMITGNIYFSCLLAMVFNELLFRMPAGFLIKRNISKSSLIDEKFFN